jgi:hypothetical protein
VSGSVPELTWKWQRRESSLRVQSNQLVQSAVTFELLWMMMMMMMNTTTTMLVVVVVVVSPNLKVL